MEKLIELLNEYNKEKTNGEIGWREREYDNEFGNLLYGRYNGGTFSTLYCISKGYGFIKWLVENDKIDRKKIEKNQTYQLCLGLLIDRGYYVNVLLMLLSISDTPIEDLISYLK